MPGLDGIFDQRAFAAAFAISDRRFFVSDSERFFAPARPIFAASLVESVLRPIMQMSLPQTTYGKHIIMIFIAF